VLAITALSLLVVVGLSTAAAVVAQQQNRLTAMLTAISGAVGAVVLFLTLGQWIGRLAKSFERMRAALRERDHELRQFTDTLQEQVRERTKELQSALTAAQDANRAKSLFLANMSHELRTPLNGVIGMVDLLLAAHPNSQQRRYCDIAKASARSLVELINDILDFSKIEAGKLEMDDTDFNLHEVIEGVPQILGERAQHKGIELLCRVDPALPRIAGGDPVRLRQLILNLASNAVKFTEKGEVIVDARVESQSDTHTMVRISVKDSGIGIPQDRLGRLFNSFSQVDASTTRKFGGTGLGLAISQRIAELMGGQIGVISEEGKGSTFWFTACLARRSQVQSPRHQSSVDPRGLRVLAVDDNQTNREILQSQLCSWSLRADIAVDAAEAIGMLRRAQEAGDPYRFAILDMHMPRTDGMELANTIKSDPNTRDVILISLSSISDQIRKEQMNERGFAACLTKPVLPSQLYDTIVTSLAANESQPLAAAAEPSTAGDRLDGVRVLLAEDNEVNRMVATELLQLVGCTVNIAVNGREAVDAALAGDHDVILMDCQMPILDGFEATRRIRELELKQPGSGHRKIIALTANAIKGDRELCLSAGMDEYVTKPIEPAELMRAMRSMLSRARLKQVDDAASAGGQANLRDGSALTPSTDPPATPTPASPMAAAPVPTKKPPAPPAVDLESLQRRCMNNRKLAAKAIRMFDLGIDRDLALVKQSVTDRNARNLAAAAHKVKGSAANVSAEPVRKIAAELERLGRADELDQTQAALEELTIQIAGFRDYMDTALSQLTVVETAAAGKQPQ
jgi:signal transduction histidine kinase/DNA-binding response OmpR family regulator/HPt (histidine-containing phosphotransfer) domain-containing protein